MKPTDTKRQMLVQITCGYPTATERIFFFFNMKNVPPSPWHTLFEQFILINKFILINSLITWFCKGDGKTADIFGDFQSELWRFLFWSSVIAIPCCTCQILFNKVRLCSTRRQSRVLLSNMAVLKTKQKRQIWQNLALTGHRDHDRVFPWCMDIRDSSLNITGQILYKKLLSKIIHLLRAILSFHIRFLIVL